MGRLTRWAAAAVGAAGAGAGLALAQRRRRACEAEGRLLPAAAAPDPSAPSAAPVEDPQAALDAARDRLRRRADELGRTMEPPQEGSDSS